MRLRIIDRWGCVGVYYYKKVNGDVLEYVEECVHEKARLPLNVAMISEDEYRELMRTFSGDEERAIEESELYQMGYEQALLDMAEVGV